MNSRLRQHKCPFCDISEITLKASPRMKKTTSNLSVAFWATLILAILLFGGWEAYGCYLTSTGSTHRAWTRQVILGGMLVFGTVLAAPPSLLIATNKRKVLAIAIIFFCAGLAPLAVRLLWRPFVPPFS